MDTEDIKITDQRNPQEAFEAAIACGRLSACATDWNYAGHFMYMFTDSKGVDAFKHCATRRYLGAGNSEIAAYEREQRVSA